MSVKLFKFNVSYGGDSVFTIRVPSSRFCRLCAYDQSTVLFSTNPELTGNLGAFEKDRPWDFEQETVLSSRVLAI